MTDTDLTRFVDAQAAVYDVVKSELAAGRKRSHWMWFVFPQIAGLGRSRMSEDFAIADLDQARRYLADPVLGKRLRDCVELMVRHQGRTALEILGSPDDLKLRSCLTLFLEAADDRTDRNLFEAALDQFYHGVPDQNTLGLLRTA